MRQSYSVCWCTSVINTLKFLVRSFGAKECLSRKCFLIDDEESLCLSTHWWRWRRVRFCLIFLRTKTGCTVVWILVYFHCFNSYHSLDNDRGPFETSSFSVDFYRKNLRTGGNNCFIFFTPNLGATLKHLRMSYQLAKQLWKIFSWSIWTYTLWVDTLVSLYKGKCIVEGA